MLLLTACGRETHKPSQKTAEPPRTPAVAAHAMTSAEEQAAQLALLLPQIEAAQDAETLVELIGRLGTLDDGAPRVLDVCRRLLGHTDARVRAAVLEELWFFDDISSMTTNFVSLLHDNDSEVRGLAAERLGEIETPAAVEFLIQNLTNKFPDAQAACQEALLMAVAERFDTPEQAYVWWEKKSADWFDE